MNLNQAFLSWQNFEQILNASQDAGFIIDADKNILYWNAEAENLLGYKTKSLMGETLPPIFENTLFDSLIKLAVKSHRKQSLKNQTKNSLETYAVREDGSDVWVQLTLTVLSTNDELCYYATFRERHKTKLSDIQLQNVSAIDDVTGLSNRREFQRMLESHIIHPLSLAIVDIDQYKQINHQFGFLEGEQALRSLADLLKSEFPDAICLARLSDDEFAILYSGGVGSGFYQKCEVFREKVTQLDMLDFDIALTVSIGVAKYVENSRQLMTKGDQALQVAKQRGRNKVHMLLK
ncbi:MAG: sensor domain-containing diguanylate cyclase [Pseudomonadota bacterium]|nr:sensor domain-containing diguanylate cyclase [Pseudomonadota bacterium]